MLLLYLLLKISFHCDHLLISRCISSTTISISWHKINLFHIIVKQKRRYWNKISSQQEYDEFSSTVFCWRVSQIPLGRTWMSPAEATATWGQEWENPVVWRKNKTVHPDFWIVVSLRPTLIRKCFFKYFSPHSDLDALMFIDLLFRTNIQVSWKYIHAVADQIWLMHQVQRAISEISIKVK